MLACRVSCASEHLRRVRSSQHSGCMHRNAHGGRRTRKRSIRIAASGSKLADGSVWRKQRPHAAHMVRCRVIGDGRGTAVRATDRLRRVDAEPCVAQAEQERVPFRRDRDARQLVVHMRHWPCEIPRGRTGTDGVGRGRTGVDGDGRGWTRADGGGRGRAHTSGPRYDRPRRSTSHTTRRVFSETSAA